jgi:hypothetical protein
MPCPIPVLPWNLDLCLICRAHIVPDRSEFDSEEEFEIWKKICKQTQRCINCIDDLIDGAISEK